MRIDGMQTLTLLDFPGKVACTLFLHGCNLRCPFCHNASLVTRPGETEVTVGELEAFLEKRHGLLDGVCVTGGEPLLNPEAEELLRLIKGKDYAVKLDTNGFFPERLKSIVEGGLADYVAMDIKASRIRYGEAVGRDGVDLAPVEESVAFLKQGRVPYEFRTTVVQELHSPEDFLSIGEWLKGTEHYYLQQYVDSGDLITSGMHAMPKEQMELCRANAAVFVPGTVLRGV